MTSISADGIGFCPWHLTDSAFVVRSQTTYATPYYYSASSHSGRPRDMHSFTGIVIMECRHCGKTVLLLRHQTGDDAASLQMISPPATPRSLHVSAPEEQRSLFREASVCEAAGAYRAAGVLYRAVVEELAQDQSASGRNLFDKIESLRQKLPDELVEDLHEARLLGNDSIHGGITYSPEEVGDVAGLIEEAVLVLYVQPAEKRAMREARSRRRQGLASSG